MGYHSGICKAMLVGFGLVHLIGMAMVAFHAKFFDNFFNELFHSDNTLSFFLWLFITLATVEMLLIYKLVKTKGRLVIFTLFVLVLMVCHGLYLCYLISRFLGHHPFSHHHRFSEHHELWDQHGFFDRHGFWHKHEELDPVELYNQQEHWNDDVHFSRFDALAFLDEVLFGILGSLALLILLIVGWVRLRRGQPIHRQPLERESFKANTTFDGTDDVETASNQHDGHERIDLPASTSTWQRVRDHLPPVYSR